VLKEKKDPTYTMAYSRNILVLVSTRQGIRIRDVEIIYSKKKTIAFLNLVLLL
jgi:hypothetical protein